MSDPQNNFKIFNEANNSEKTMSDSDYATDIYRLQGLTPMMANPKAHNKMFRQWSIMCKAIADMIGDKGYDATDEDVTDLKDNLKSSVKDLARDELSAEITTLGNINTWKQSITATASELNYSAGVTSNIQTQINNLATSGFFPLWQASTAYSVGDVVKTPNLSFFQYMEALSSGTSGATLTISDTSTGKSVLDNNIIWLICDSRDGRQVGEIALSPLYSSISSNENIWSSTIINNGYLLLGNGGTLLTNQDNGQKIINPQNWFTNYSFIRLIKASINTVLRNFDVQLHAGTNEYNPGFTHKFFDFSIFSSSLQYRVENPFTAEEISAGGFIILNSLCKYPTTLTSELLTEDGLDWGWNSDFSQMTSARRMEVAEELFTLMTTDDSNEQYPTYMYYSIGTTNERYIRMALDTDIALDMEAGLPNISATVGYLRSQGMNETIINGYLNNDSALKWKTKRTDSKEENLSTTSNNSMADLILDASKSNSIYGKNWTVTPQNISFNTYIKL